MRDERLRRALDALIDDNEIEEEVIILENHAYDHSIVGLTADGRLIYDFDSMVREFAEDEDCDEIEAVEWVEYNTMRALPYMGERAPIVLMHSCEKILEIYGD